LRDVVMLLAARLRAFSTFAAELLPGVDPALKYQPSAPVTL
jgi:hypothetical protein